jgi:hypothetical protein
VGRGFSRDIKTAMKSGLLAPDSLPSLGGYQFVKWFLKKAQSMQRDSGRDTFSSLFPLG